MLRLLRRNPKLHQITQSESWSLLPNLRSNGAAADPQTNLSPIISFFSSPASKLPQEAPKTKDPIFDFFHSYGFTAPQIKRFLHKSWSVRSTETMKPKLEHLLALGLSPSELVRSICYYPTVLDCSLKKRIEPNLNLLETTLGSKTHIIKAIIRGPWLITQNLEKRVIPNVEILRKNNIPMDNIIRVFTRFPGVLVKDPSLIIETISKLKGLGMSHSNQAFINGVNIMVSLKKETWERKMELYRSLEWSEKDTLSVFSRHPTSFGLSDDKIKEKMKFFKERLQWDSAIVAKLPVVLTYSLEKRIIPRCAVLSVLAKIGLWKGKPKLYILFYMTEKNFKERFVDKYEKEVPQVIDAYQGKIDFVGFESIRALTLV